MSGEEKSSDKIDFGKHLRDQFYKLDPKLALTNHGSYGSAPRPILEKKRHLQDEMEASPDEWFRFRLVDLWTTSLSSLASYLAVGGDQVLIGNNATECINAVLKSIQFEADNTEAILTTSLNYQAILNSIDYTSKYRLKDTNYIHVHQINLNLPIKDKNELIEEFNEACKEIVVKKKLRLRLAVVDHISSATAILYPITEIGEIIRKWAPDCSILIDGAHAIGHVKLDLKSFGCDFYVSNLHKWFFAPRSCSFIYTSDPNNFKNHSFQPCYISHGYNQDAWHNFYQRGTSDNTSWFVVDECIGFYETYLGGHEKISAYCSELINRARDMLIKAWRTERLAIGEDIEAPFMKVIKLPPLRDYIIKPGGDPPPDVVCARLIKRLSDDFKVIGCCVIIENELYIRISTFVYNSIEDYERLRDAILALV